MLAVYLVNFASYLSIDYIFRYKTQSLNLPEDLHYPSKDLLSLFLRPKVFVSNLPPLGPIAVANVFHWEYVMFSFCEV